MIYPEFLKSNSTIGITAPSDGTDNEVKIACINNAIENFNKLDFNITETPNVRTSYKGRSCDSVSRYEQFKKLLVDNNVNMILSSGGGDFLCEMLPLVDFELIKANPKWIQGYSDPTGLTYSITTLADIATVYSSNYGEFGMEELHSSLIDNIRILKGESIVQTSFPFYQNGFIKKQTGLENYILTEKTKYNIVTGEQNVTLKGRQLGGCLDCLLNLVGTPFEDTKGFIKRYKNDKIVWYLESFSLDSEGLIRGLWQLKACGWFENCSGFVFGRPAFYTTYSETSFNEAVLTALGDLNVPIITGVDIGHIPPRMTVVNGSLAKWEVDNNGCKYTQYFK